MLEKIDVGDLLYCEYSKRFGWVTERFDKQHKYMVEWNDGTINKCNTSAIRLYKKLLNRLRSCGKIEG